MLTLHCKIVSSSQKIIRERKADKLPSFSPWILVLFIQTFLALSCPYFAVWMAWPVQLSYRPPWAWWIKVWDELEICEYKTSLNQRKGDWTSIYLKFCLLGNLLFKKAKDDILQEHLIQSSFWILQISCRILKATGVKINLVIVMWQLGIGFWEIYVPVLWKLVITIDFHQEVTS